MSRIFITGSSDGIGLLTARTLISQGHHVVLHARNAQRASQTRAAAPGAADVLVADISSIREMKALAEAANKFGTFDTVIHNAGLGFRQPYVKTEDGIAQLFAVNSLAPYVLTALMHKPKRLVYVSSGLHTGGDASLKDVTWTSGRSWNGMQAYSDSKLHDVLLASAIARRWKDVSSYSMSPGWVKTKMGGSEAPGSTEKGADTLVWLASNTEEDNRSMGSGEYVVNRRSTHSHSSAGDVKTLDKFLEICKDITGISLSA